MPEIMQRKNKDKDSILFEILCMKGEMYMWCPKNNTENTKQVASCMIGFGIKMVELSNSLLNIMILSQYSCPYSPFLYPPLNRSNIAIWSSSLSSSLSGRFLFFVKSILLMSAVTEKTVAVLILYSRQLQWIKQGRGKKHPSRNLVPDIPRSFNKLMPT